ncbi:MAG TPA: ABC transporter ATP-binding protein [Candidatus Methylomirabilis sp.]|nr:ABC transporter ATP-binding protein [Candidatus Methylomirabilis sp.]
MRESSLLEVENLRVEFPTPTGSVRAADGVSFRLSRGEIVGLVGESGCGKTVTTLALLRLVRPPGRIAAGRILFKGRDLLTLPDHEMRALRGGEMAMIFQNPMTALDPVFTVGDHIAEVFRAHSNLRTADVPTAAAEVLQRVRVPNPRAQLKAYPHQFSGGMAQRLMIGMGLAGRPSLLIADEPTTALDVSVQAQILALLRAIRTELQTAIVLITHDLAITAQLCDRIVVMYAGQVQESSPTRDLFRAPQHPYTRGLLDSMPRLGHKRGRLEQIPGQPPDLRALPLGCRFAPRCPRAEARCHAEEPVLAPSGDGREVRCHFPLEAR